MDRPYTRLQSCPARVRSPVLLARRPAVAARPWRSTLFEIAESLVSRIDAGESVAVVTVTHVLGSAPRALGSSMAVDPEGAAIGSISGGCVEGQAYALAERILDTGSPAAEHFGFDDVEAFAAGLSCGGQIRVFGHAIAPEDEGVVAQLRAAVAGRAAGIALVIDGPAEVRGARIAPSAARAADAPESDAPVPHGQDDARSGALDPDDVRRIRAELDARIRSGRSGTVEIVCGDDVLEVCHLVAARPPRLIVFGAVDFSAALARAGALLGYRVTICDARSVFATPERFPDAHEVVVEWPADYLARTEVDERTAIAVLTHDEKFDIPLLVEALGRGAGYVGAMGSRRTHERRMRLLGEAGIDERRLLSLRSPIGLDIGASTPEETAVSILAEIIAVRTGASGASLATTSGPIHVQF